MKLSKLLGERYKEKPNEAFLDSHIFMLRGGYIRQVSNGIFTLLTPAKRIVRKIEEIIRQEMDIIDGQEVLFPVVLPGDLWNESGRFQSVGSELLRFKDRTDKDMLLGMTHEEAAVHLARTEAKSYNKYPFMIYQIQTKFRDEPRARGGLVRVREFTMKDAYSFHTDTEDLEQYYMRVFNAYNNIFKRLGLKDFISVKSDSGMMGGNIAHEFMYLSEGGEDTLVICDSCDYRSNMEVAVADTPNSGKEKETFEEIHTPNIKSIDELAEYLGINAKEILKATVFIKKDSQKPVIAFIRGDLEVNETKLAKLLSSEIYPLTTEVIDGLCLGFIGPKDLNLNVEILYDKSLSGEDSLIAGTNKKDYHYKGFSLAEQLENIQYSDFSKVRTGDICLNCGKPLTVKRGIEIGNIFQLGDKYTKSMHMTYTDKEGSLKTPIMGCYGIGVGRVFACILENHNDEYGPIWPMSVAPWDIHICALNINIPEVKNIAFDLYNKLSQKYDVLIDDRPVNAGIQFADADLLGIPIRIIISKRNVEKGEVEITKRDKSIKIISRMNEVILEIEKMI